MGDEEKKEKKKKSKKKAEEPAAEAPPPAPTVPEPAPSEPAPAPTETAPEPAPPAPDAAEPVVTEPEPEPEPEPTPPPAPVTKPSTKKKAQRTASSVFAMFTATKVQEFKEAFQLIDQDKDGFISKHDLKATFESLGKDVEDRDIDTMIAEAPGPINFTMFLTIFGDRIAGAVDDEKVIMNAFRMFDESAEGKIREDILRHALMCWGEHFTAEEADECLKEAHVDYEGFINIRRFTRTLTTGEDQEMP